MICLGQRKVDLIIVEGPSDETALAAPLSVVLSDGLVKILVMYGDITTRDGVYIPDEAVTFDESVSKTVYTDDGIVSPHVRIITKYGLSKIGNIVKYTL